MGATHVKKAALLTVLILVFLAISTFAQLDIDEVDVFVNGIIDHSAKTSGGTIDEIRPGDNISFIARVQNDYSTTDDIDLDDVIISFRLKEIDNGKDIFFKGDKERLDPGEKAQEIFNFAIPYSVAQDSYSAELIVDYDDDGTSKRRRTSYKFNVLKDDHSITIVRATVQSPVSLCSPIVPVDLLLVNTGNSDETIVLKINSEGFGTLFRKDLLLASNPARLDNSYSQPASIDISKLEIGIRNLVVQLNFGPNTVEKSLKLEVIDCQNGVQQSTAQTTPQTNNLVEDQDGAVLITGGPSTTQQTVRSGDFNYTTGLIIGAIVVLNILIILELFGILRKVKKK
ncbi:hypothetical protein GOV04_04350 [Candidatus Woesearchaeota archaeon]|nr:hypothetical protein [Candidatus Woesearchaeota archaeon]